MPQNQSLADAFDAPWKIALDVFFELFLRLCFPAVHERINWTEPPQFLENELRQIAPVEQQELWVVG